MLVLTQQVPFFLLLLLLVSWTRFHISIWNFATKPAFLCDSTVCLIYIHTHTLTHTLTFYFFVYIIFISIYLIFFKKKLKIMFFKRFCGWTLKHGIYLELVKTSKKRKKTLNLLVISFEKKKKKSSRNCFLLREKCVQRSRSRRLKLNNIISWRVTVMDLNNKRGLFR